MLISFVVPVYNAEDTVENCVNSILNQSFESFEVILVNDGSTDGSLEICNKFSRHPKVKIINQANAGVSASRNRGIELSKGTHICFIDSDDWIDSSYLKDFISEFEDDTTLIIQDILKDFKSYEEVNANYKPAEITLDNKNLLLQDYGLLRHGYPFCKFYSAEIIKKNNLKFYEDLDFSEDLIFFVEYLTHVNKLKFLDSTNYHYLISLEGSLSKRYFHFESELRSLNLIKDRFEKLFENSELDQKSIAIVNYAKGYPTTRVLESMFRQQISFSKNERLDKISLLGTKEHKAYYSAYNQGFVKKIAARLFSKGYYRLFDSYLNTLFFVRYRFGKYWIKYRTRLKRYRII
ncbi:glycosyltransferase family 2 protein [Croceivirga thetidis]|uniref:Glycosyltransferase n=1 Tax=Croceivirga thetidis TaxID=2721623 RepID=A0ABX1GSJ7_9FLAO|nr:glycosyltransferase family 2 protein [Croceivirga thetidis]NKI32021.1 glycosyltransferase [Croceivirga thetidis]